MSLSAFLKMSRKSWQSYQPQTDLHAQSWSFMFFLVSSKQGWSIIREYADSLQPNVDEITNIESGYKALEQHGIVNLKNSWKTFWKPYLLK